MVKVFLNKYSHNNISWEEFWIKHRPTLEKFPKEFVRQIIYENIDRLLECCVWFDENVTVEECLFSGDILMEDVSYDNDCDIKNEWLHIYNQRPTGYIIYDHMQRYGTWPFPIVLMSQPDIYSSVVCTNQFLLVEGTHRFSFLYAMITKGILQPEIKHRVFIIHPPKNYNATYPKSQACLSL